MAEVSLKIHGHQYGVSCDDGQEPRVIEVGHYVDRRARDIASAGAASNETHLLVLTSLVLADEVKELRDHLEFVHASAPAADQAASPMTDDQEIEIAAAIDSLASRIDTIASRLKRI